MFTRLIAAACSERAVFSRRAVTMMSGVFASAASAARAGDALAASMASAETETSLSLMMRVRPPVLPPPEKAATQPLQG